MLTKEEIFKDIQNIMKNDYAGYIDKQDVNRPEQYTVYNDMSDRAFEETIQNYLLDFQDGHLWFIDKNSSLPNRGFSVRRFEDTLYVTAASQEEALAVGDEIIKVDGEAIPTLAHKHAKRLEEELPERQLWDTIIRRSTNAVVKRDEEIFELTLSDYEPESYQSIHSFELFDNDTAYMKLTDFAEDEPIQKIVNNNQGVLSEISNLIIDVRVNNGGNDMFYFPLLHYVFDQTLQFPDLFSKDEVMYTNYTKRNCKLWVQDLKEYMNQELEQSTVELLKEDIKKVENNDGKGLQEVPEDTDFEIKGSPSPERIYVLTDYFCGSSGDTFVSNVKKSPKVTVVGRATMGIMDYFDVVTIDYDNFELSYGISKMNSNYSINGKGVEPHIYIPWTPDHLKKDVDLEYVLDNIKKQN